MVIHYTRDQLLALGNSRTSLLNRDIRLKVSEFSLQLPRRGCRAGAHRRRRLLAVRSATSSLIHSDKPWEIPVINGHRTVDVNNDQLFHEYRRHDDRVPVLQVVRRHRQRDSVRVGLFNARSVGNKSASIQQWITDAKLNVVALAETWHDDALSPDLIACAPVGFKFVEKARQRVDNLSLRTNHGGICLLYDNSLNIRLIQLPTFTSFESLAVYVYRAGFNAVIVVLYRPGSSNVTQLFFDELSDMLERLAIYSSPLVIVGDFNVHVDDRADTSSAKLHDILVNYCLQQHVASPTHVCGHILDLFITRDSQDIVMMPIDTPLLSDHSFVVGEVNCLTPASASVSRHQVRNWRTFDIDAFTADLLRTKLVVSPPCDVTDAFTCYNDTLRLLLDKHAPSELKLVRRRSDTAPWYDKECRSVKKTTRNLERRYRSRRTVENKSAWRQQFDFQRNFYQNKVNSFWTTTVNEHRNNPRRLWKTVDKLLQPPKQDLSTKLTADDFAIFFKDKVAKIRLSTATASRPVISSRQTPSLSSFPPVTVEEITKLLNSSPSKSCQLDPIPTWLLKRLSTHITPVICHLCNLTMQSGIFPSVLKEARVRPLLKKSTLDPDNASSYRPISNLSYISKLVERVVVKRFTNHVGTHNLFPVQQSAYRPFHSTETAVLSVHDLLVRSIDNNQISVLVLLDLSAAFDTVDHEILLSVLSGRFGVNGTALNWFRSYLSGRTQTFTYAGNQSISYQLDCSVPQGSVLGPVEFVSYTEDIVELFERHRMRSYLYADDTQLLDSCRLNDIKNVQVRVRDCTNEVAHWCESRRLQLNGEKTEAIWVGSRSNLTKLSGADRSLTVSSTTIQPTSVVRDLGVLLDDELSMKQHVSKVAATCFYQLRRLRQIRRRVGQDVTLQLVMALIIPRLDYCNSVLAALPSSTLHLLQRVQNTAARLVFELRHHDHVTPAFIQLHWLPIRWRIHYKLCTLMHAVHTGRCPHYLVDIVTLTSHRQTRSGLRSADSTNYTIPRLRTKFGERAFSYAGPAAWNSLPADLRVIQETAAFRRRLKTHCFNLAFNTM